jgi:hypothetical protein
MKMNTSIYLDPVRFVEKVIKAMKLGDIPGDMLLAVKEAVTDKLADRIVGTVISSFGAKDLEFFEKLMNEKPQIDEMDAVFLTAQNVKGLDAKLEREIESLYKELTYDAEKIEEAIQFNKKQNDKR